MNVNIAFRRAYQPVAGFSDSQFVPGLAAKPIIDIVVAVDDITSEEDYLDPLLAAGFVDSIQVPKQARRIISMA